MYKFYFNKRHKQYFKKQKQKTQSGSIHKKMCVNGGDRGMLGTHLEKATQIIDWSLPSALRAIDVERWWSFPWGNCETDS